MSESAPSIPSGCYAVVFTSKRNDLDPDGYATTADQMVELAAQQSGFLGIESARGSDGVGITVSYWESLDAIRKWREHPEHRDAQRLGKERWYDWFELRIARVEGVTSFRRLT